MEKGEITWRAGQLLQRFMPAGGDPEAGLSLVDGLDWPTALDRFRAAADRPVLLDRARATAIAKRQPALVAELTRAADQAAQGCFAFFGYPAVTLKSPIDWHHDPFADLRWPDAPSHRLDHRVAAGDVKWIWELNRLQHLPLLAQGWLFTGDSRYSTAAFEQIDGWIDQNPFGRGIAWRGAFEAGLRSVSIAIAVQGLRDAPELTVERYRGIAGVLAESARRCWKERSLFSSANNHLVGEMAGLALVGMMFPELRCARDWERDALNTLTTEAGRQILPDGAGAEQSVGYQMATVELLHMVAVLVRERDGAATTPITEAIARSSRFLAAVVGEVDPEPRYGDADQEFAVRLGPEPVRTVRDHLGIVAASGLGGVRPPAGSDTLSAQWFGEVSQAAATAVPVGADGSFLAADGGLVVLRDGCRRLTMDVGKLGYLSIAAHGHADALAVTVALDGHDIIGDPGTGSYYQHPQWRARFRGTRAHATVSIDGLDQSVIGGPFLWSRHAGVTLRGVDLSTGVVDAEHDGYTRLPGRVVHRRWLIAPPKERCQLVVDMISALDMTSATASHEVRTTWPLHPDLHVERIEQGRLLTRGGTAVAQILHAANRPWSVDDARGEEATCLGWWSDRLEQRVPAWWLGTVCHTALPFVMATLISPADGGVPADLAVDLRANTVDVSWREDSRPRTVEVRADYAAAVRWRNQARDASSLR
jgi:hypothetical protein